MCMGEGQGPGAATMCRPCPCRVRRCTLHIVPSLVNAVCEPIPCVALR